MRREHVEPSSEPVSRGELSPRELEILRLVARGLENAQIAAELNISPRTAKTTCRAFSASSAWPTASRQRSSLCAADSAEERRPLRRGTLRLRWRIRRTRAGHEAERKRPPPAARDRLPQSEMASLVNSMAALSESSTCPGRPGSTRRSRGSPAARAASRSRFAALPRPAPSVRAALQLTVGRTLFATGAVGSEGRWSADHGSGSGDPAEVERPRNEPRSLLAVQAPVMAGPARG